MSLSFSKRWAGYLAKKTGQPRENEAILAFVIEMIVINLVNTGIMLSLGFIFNVLPGIITCLVTVAMLRFTAGGAHSNSPWRCAIITALVFLAIAIISSYLPLVDKLLVDILAALTITVGILLMIRYAPVDSPSAPIKSTSRRKRLKFLSLVVVLLIAFLIVLFRESTWEYAREVQAAMILCVLWSSFNLTNTAHHIMSFVDGIDKSKEKEVS